MLGRAVTGFITLIRKQDNESPYVDIPEITKVQTSPNRFEGFPGCVQKAAGGRGILDVSWGLSI